MEKDSKKVTKHNYDEFNNSGIESNPIKIGFFNRLLKDFETLWDSYVAQAVILLAHMPSTGVSKMNTINEYTSSSGVTIEDVLIKDGKVGGINTITTTAGGTGAGQITAVEQFVIINSANADYIASLPLLSAFVTGAHIQGSPLNTGCELRVHLTDRTSTKYINGVTGGNELKINNGTGCAYFDAVKVDINKWIVKTYSSLGAPTTLIPDK